MPPVQRTYYGQLKAAEVTPDGFLSFECVATRAGVFPYAVGGQVRMEYRPEEELLREDTLESLRQKPITILHPTDASGRRVYVTPQNAHEHVAGAVGDGVEVAQVVGFAPPDEPGPYVKANGILYRADAIKGVLDEELPELSCGFASELDPTPGIAPCGTPYDAVQRNIRFNHLALVPRGRAGRSATMRLDADDNQIEDPTPSLTPPPHTSPTGREEHTMKFKLPNGYTITLTGDSAQADVEALMALKADAEMSGTLKADMDKMKAGFDAMKADMEKMKPAFDQAQARLDEMKAYIGDMLQQDMEVEEEMAEEIIEEMVKGDSVDKVKGKLEVVRKAARARAAEAVKERLGLLQQAAALKVDGAEGMDTPTLRRAIYKVALGEEPKADASDMYIAGAISAALKMASKTTPAGQSALGSAMAQTTLTTDSAHQDARAKYLASLGKPVAK